MLVAGGWWVQMLVGGDLDADDVVDSWDPGVARDIGNAGVAEVAGLAVVAWVAGVSWGG